MGVMKRLDDWRRYYPPLPQPLRAFAGLEPYRDPEAFKERKAAEREAREERLAIQEDSQTIPNRQRNPGKAEVIIPKIIPEPDPDNDPPRLAAAGWYRVGPTFYRIGSGPHPAFYAARSGPPPERQAPAKLQLSMFD